ncbi:MFS transporter [Advenella sp. WQ 585]|jgi:predicted MFS family arabinose efflux permease|uniref:MFS transporter n=1 Tax=Advenella mandrilli TaxID=2800330 RepID=A0ABS1EHJ5_9BURK|nr:MFS transporter [Advenella mandrilli]MBK1782492.1 MFS transporter [Advenella mandrilli]MDY0273696.1 MFS transporter [Advenella sp.]NLN68952.1 MFS transporter [Alcaligenaceae bacterium]
MSTSQANVSADIPKVSANPDRALVLITALGIGQICGWGSLYYSFPLIAEAMMAELGWSRTNLYGAATAGLVLAGFLAYPVGVAVDKGYGRRLMAGASLLAGLLIFMWSQVSSLLGFYLIIAGVGALQAATLYEPAFAVIVRRVGPARARSGITAITLWGGFASTVFIPLVQFLLDHWGWRDALLVLALINGVLCAALYYGFIRPEKDIVHVIPSHHECQQQTDQQAIRASFRQPVFWLLMLALTAYAGAFTAFTFHMYPLFLEGGLSTQNVVWVIATIGPAQVAGRILISMFGAGMSMRRIGTLVVVIFPLVFIVLALQPSSFWIVAAACIAYGASNGIFTIVRGLVVPEMLSTRAYGALNGILTFPSTLAKAFAPLVAAWIWSSTMSYGAVSWAIAICAILLAISFWLAAWVSRR